MKPFIIYALPRSRTAWLSRFLSYGKTTCYHEQGRFIRSAEDVRLWFQQEDVGVADTLSPSWWRLIQHYRPDVSVVVIRRPIEEVLASMLRLDLGFRAEVLEPVLRRQDRRLKQITDTVPGVLEVSFKQLEEESWCRKIFEHCLPYPYDSAWWSLLSKLNIQCNMAEITRYMLLHVEPLFRARDNCWAEMRKTLVHPHKEDGFTFQSEPWEFFWHEGQQLFANHAMEVGFGREHLEEVNAPFYSDLYDQGALEILTARANGRLFGYLLTTIMQSLSHKSSSEAIPTVFYVSPDARGARLGLRLHRENLKALRARGVGRVIFRAGVSGDGPRLDGLYRRLGASSLGQLYQLDLRETV